MTSIDSVVGLLDNVQKYGEDAKWLPVFELTNYVVDINKLSEDSLYSASIYNARSESSLMLMRIIMKDLDWDYIYSQSTPFSRMDDKYYHNFLTNKNSATILCNVVASIHEYDNRIRFTVLDSYFGRQLFTIDEVNISNNKVFAALTKSMVDQMPYPLKRRVTLTLKKDKRVSEVNESSITMLLISARKEHYSIGMDVVKSTFLQYAIRMNREQSGYITKVHTNNYKSSYDITLDNGHKQSVQALHTTRWSSVRNGHVSYIDYEKDAPTYKRIEYDDCTIT